MRGLIAIALLSMCACGDSGPSGPDPDDAVASVTISPTQATVNVGSTIQLTATVRNGRGESMVTAVTWASATPGVGTVNNSGMVTGVAEGSTTVTASAGGFSDSATLEVVFVFACTLQSEIPLAECQALEAMYNDTNGPGWIDSTNWLEDVSPCGWYGVMCDEGTVSGLDLKHNELAGTISPELGDLTNLEQLKLDHNQLTGPIPTELGGLTLLEQFHLQANELTGTIPPELGNLTNVERIYLDQNQLTGTIPSELGNLSALLWLLLGTNQLTGTIPPELGNLSRLGVISLSANELTGIIPPEFGNLTELRILSLIENQLTGTIPPSLGNLHLLKHLALDENQLTGDIPEELGGIATLEGLFLRDNQLSSPIPLAVAQIGGLIQNKYGDTSCQILPGNPGVSLPDTQAYRDADLDGDGFICMAEFTPPPVEVR